jgi:sigma-B regulation protein RsbU (phosphoserine phosphatase)
MWRNFALLACLACNVFAQRVVSHAKPEHWTAELNGTWLWHAGDDVQWATSSFDDSKWSRLAVPGPAPSPIRYWIRIPVRLPPVSDPGLLVGPISFAYNVYFDGKQIGNFGKLPPKTEWFIPRWNLVRIPPELVSTADHVIAIQIRNVGVAWGTRVPRRTARDNRVGNFTALSEVEVGLKSTDFHIRLLDLLFSSVIILAGFYFFLLPPTISEGAAFRWFGAALIFKGLQEADLFYANDAYLNISGATLLALAHVTMVFFLVAFANFAYALFGKRVSLRVRSFQVLLIIFLVTELLVERRRPIDFLATIFFALAFVVSLVPVAISVNQLRKGFPGSALILAVFSVVTLVMLENLLARLGWSPFGTAFYVGPFRVNNLNGALVLWIPAMAFQIHKANQRLRDERERLRGEMEAAQRVQEILLPSRAIQVPGFQIEATYRPATEVGGDFYQLFPASGNSLLVVAGDVSGKGMKAALLVSVIVGASQNRKSSQPSALLRELNTVLLGRSEGGFTTCCCALFDGDGALTIANAGHLAPYRNGHEMETPPALPLGIDADAHWPDIRMHLDSGDRILWFSDGVLEARNGKRELLGYDRAEELTARTATAIAQVAQQYGQDDDITAVSITLDKAAVHVA